MPVQDEYYHIDFGFGHFTGTFLGWLAEEESDPHKWMMFDTGEVETEYANVYGELENDTSEEIREGPD